MCPLSSIQVGGLQFAVVGGGGGAGGLAPGVDVAGGAAGVSGAGALDDGDISVAVQEHVALGVPSMHMTWAWSSHLRTPP